MRWIQRYVPEFEKRWNRFGRPVGRSGAVAKPTSKSKDDGPVSTVRSTKREKPSISCCASSGASPPPRPSSDGRAGARGRLPHKITLDGYQASHCAAKEAIGEHSEGNRCDIRSSKYVNNLIEEDHLSIKLRLGPMLGLKHFRRAATTIAGIELIHRVRTGQVKLKQLQIKDKTAPAIWNAVLDV
jgi:transposase-like protein